MSSHNTICPDSRPCFARDYATHRCTILERVYKKDGDCPFAKRYRSKRKDGSPYKCKMKEWVDGTENVEVGK